MYTSHLTSVNDFLRAFAQGSQDKSPQRKDVKEEANEPDEQLTAALSEANAKMLQYSQDATDAHEAMMKAVYENEKLAAALKKYDEAMPEMR